MCRCTPGIRTPYCNNCNDIMPRRGVYREGTKLFDILEDGWSRGFEPFQTKIEAQDAGYLITTGEVEIAFMIFQEKMERILQEET